MTLLAGAVACGALLASAAPAFGATVASDGTTVTVAGGAAANTTIVSTGLDGASIEVSDAAGVQAGAGCEFNATFGKVECPLPSGAIVVAFGAGDDQLTGGFGNDTIVGGSGQDIVNADRPGRCIEAALRPAGRRARRRHDRRARRRRRHRRVRHRQRQGDRRRERQHRGGVRAGRQGPGRRRSRRRRDAGARGEDVARAARQARPRARLGAAGTATFRARLARKVAKRIRWARKLVISVAVSDGARSARTKVTVKR